MSKTVSARLQDDEHELLREKCNQKDCTLNDFVKNAIDEKLTGSNSLFKDCIDCDQEVHDMMTKIVNNIHDAEYSITSSEKTDKPIKVTLIWSENDDEGVLGKIKQDDPKPTSQIIYVDD